MDPTLAPEDIDNMLIYERSSERRSGIDRRLDGRMNNKDLHHPADKADENKQPAEIRFIGDFG